MNNDLTLKDIFNMYEDYLLAWSIKNGVKNDVPLRTATVKNINDFVHERLVQHLDTRLMQEADTSHMFAEKEEQVTQERDRSFASALNSIRIEKNPFNSIKSLIRK